MHQDPEVDSSSNRNEYQEYLLWGEGGQYLGLAKLPASNLKPSEPVIGRISYKCEPLHPRLYMGADKSTARPGRKQATATKL